MPPWAQWETGAGEDEGNDKAVRGEHSALAQKEATSKLCSELSLPGSIPMCCCASCVIQVLCYALQLTGPQSRLPYSCALVPCGCTGPCRPGPLVGLSMRPLPHLEDSCMGVL